MTNDNAQSKNDSVKKLHRRDFLKWSGRLAILSGIGLLLGRFGRHGQVKLRGQRCINRSICRQCPALQNCELPAALSMKQQRGGSLNAR